MLSNDKLDQIVCNLKYLILTPSVTTMGACPECKQMSRGCRVCPDCLISEAPIDWQPTLRHIALCLEAQQRNALLLESLVESLYDFTDGV